MAKQTINIGAAPNDGTGTPLRTSFDYTNQNFTELYTALGGGVGLPGATTQVIFNDGGTNLAGDAGLTYDKTTDALTVVGALSGSKLTVTGGTIPANGVYLPAANTLEFAANSLAQYRIAPLGVFSWYDGAGGTRMTLNSTALGVGVAPVAGRGALQLSAGVGFPATQVASTDANTLDDYAETNFTPTIVGSTTAGTATYSSATGRATKVGRLVTFSLRVIYSAGTGTGNLRVGGLPYTVGYASVCAVEAENIALTALYYPVATAQVSNTTIAIEQLPTGGGAAAAVPYDAAGDITVSGSYIV